MPDSAPRLHVAGDAASYLAVIRVVGVGGAGVNAVNRMIEAGIAQVEFVAVNTDLQPLADLGRAGRSSTSARELTRGLGSGSDPEIGRRAAEEGYDQIKHALRGSRHGLRHRRRGRRHRHRRRARRRADRARLGALTVGIVTKPFGFEGTRRAAQADERRRGARAPRSTR